MVVILMGVCGSGKTAVGLCLAELMGCAFFDGDDFHSEANVEKMRTGVALTDEDRQPWLEGLGEKIEEWGKRPEGAVLACSALTEAYRATLGAGKEGVVVVYLKGSKALLAERIAGRAGHYMPPTLLNSQLAKLEEPADGVDGVVVGIEESPKEIAGEIMRRLGLGDSLEKSHSD